MKITRIRVFKSPIRLREPFVTSLGALTHADNIIVVLDTDSGLKGFGECSPFMTINGESMDTCFIVGRYIGQLLLGKDPLQIADHHVAMDRLIYGNSSIKSAFDIALQDISAQEAAVPLYQFLGGSINKKLFTDYTVSVGEAEKMTQAALAIKEAGYTVIKVKLGGTKAEDLERISKIREAIGSEIPLRIDANQGWETQTAIELLNELHPYNIQHCEEPIARWNFMELARVRKASLIPVMADESCCDHHDAERLVALQACDQFNIKLGKSSGIYKAGKIAAIASKAGMKMQVGGFLESRLAFTASAHFALSDPNIVHCDFDTPLMFEEDPVSGGISYGEHGLIIFPEANGLGATIEENYLRGLEQLELRQ